MPDHLRPSYPIRTERLLLRPHRVEDLDDLVRFHSDPDVVRYVPWPVRDRDATARALEVKLTQDAITEPGQWLVLAVEHDATVIGEVLLKWESAAHRQGEIGYALAREHHGRGFAVEAARAMLRLGFDELGLHRIVGVCVEQNEASGRVLQRLGFRREARLVDNIHFKGAWTTELVYAITEDDWRSAATDPDVDDLLDLVRCFFAAFASGDGVDDRLDVLRAVTLPGATIVRTCGSPPETYDLDSFLAPRRALLTDGSLTDFREQATRGRVEVFGDVAHWFGRYVKDGRLHGEPYAGAGVKSIQFVRTKAGWRISAAARDDERPGLSGYRDVHRFV